MRRNDVPLVGRSYQAVRSGRTKLRNRVKDKLVNGEVRLILHRQPSLPLLLWICFSVDNRNAICERSTNDKNE
jgi:hypothetical protein